MPREEGSSLITSLIGAVILLISVLTATHVLVSLQRRSVVGAVALDAATDVARYPGGDVNAATRRIKTLVGQRSIVDWSVADDTVTVRVRLRATSVLAKGPLAGLGRIDLSATARREQLIDDPRVQSNP